MDKSAVRDQLGRALLVLLLQFCHTSTTFAQVNPEDFPNGAPKGAWSQGGAGVNAGPPLDCEGTWTAWTACSPTALQSRFFEPTRWSANGGEACPTALTQERACNYSGPRLLLANGNPSSPWRPKCSSQGVACEWPILKAATGDSVVFYSPSGRPKVARQASTWHYSACDMSGAEDVGLDLVVSSAGILVNDMYRYVIPGADRGRSIYFSSSDAQMCSMGQRVRVEVEAFQHGNLEAVLGMLENEAYTSALGAQVMLEKLWCTVEHCPQSAVSYYRADGEAAEQRCEADSYSLLGFVARKRPSPNLTASRAYYERAIQIMPTHCEAHAYLGELFLQADDFTSATEQYHRLEKVTASSESPSGCASAFESLQLAWNDKGWCAPPHAKQEGCSSSAGRRCEAGWAAAGAPALLAVLLVLATQFLHLF